MTMPMGTAKSGAQITSPVGLTRASYAPQDCSNKILVPPFWHMSQSSRPLVPAPSGLVRGGQDAGQVYQAEARNKRESGPKARAACNPCRTRKTKCDAQRPICGACTSRDSPCEYDIPPGTSRYTSLKRKHEDLEKENAQLLELFDMLKHRPESDAYSILHRIRTSNDLLSVLAFIRAGDVLIQARTSFKAPAWSPPPPRANSSTEILLNTYHTHAYPTVPPLEDSGTDLGQKRESVLDIEAGGSSTLTDDEIGNARSLSKPHKLCDDRLYRVKASQWTTVTDDDTIVANLLSLYLSWEHTTLRLFDEDYFLDQLADGKKSYCSPLLVNAILAIATLNYISIDSTETNGLSRRFFQEARRLWHEEEGKVELLHVPAAIFLNAWCNYNSKDRLGSLFLAQGVQIAKDSRLFRRLHMQDDEMDEESPEHRRGRAIIAWGIFNWQAVHGFLNRTGSHFSRPPTAPIPYEADEEEDDNWHSFPLFRPQQSRRLQLTSKTFSELFVILNDHMHRCEGLPNPRDQEAGFENARLLHNQMLHWADKLPPEMLRSPECLPPVLSMHMIYHSVVIEAFRPFRTLRTTPLSTSSEPLAPPTSIARQIMDASLTQLRRLFYIQRHRYGGPPLPGLLAMPLHILASALLEDLAEAQGLQTQQPAPAPAPDQEPTPSSSGYSSSAPSPVATRANENTQPGKGGNISASETNFYLTLVVASLYDFGKSYPIVHVLLHSLLATFTSNPNHVKIPLPQEVDDVRRELQDKLFRRASIAEIQERYPVEGEILSTDPTKTAVEELVRAAREIGLGGKEKGEGRGKRKRKGLGGVWWVGRGKRKTRTKKRIRRAVCIRGGRVMCIGRSEVGRGYAGWGVSGEGLDGESGAYGDRGGR
ncbi:hypothetical protein K491DRAFT_671684 [Lophiostoma macrostomum CBS 122681]|uniref:Zn(2)-C6 fungal-type domain-containing protein n=1 Tax=Lophiostoma macrostomum CBS 122681 TaxID=1314788 RepID=A0A6A6SJ61_9PLEO|nr:hypothetical protein K491DRAFT_671684 [Lophiostoma macrostomum CBS 122681]